MASRELSTIMEKIANLSKAEQLELRLFLDKRTEETRELDKPRIKWRDVNGASPSLLGTGAQEWVSE